METHAPASPTSLWTHHNVYKLFRAWWFVIQRQQQQPRTTPTHERIGALVTTRYNSACRQHG